MKTVKLDEAAFARGVDEVLTLRPIRRIAEQVIWGKSSSTTKRGETSKPTGTELSGRNQKKSA